MITRIWLTVYYKARIWSHIWPTIYGCTYMIDSIWLPVYDWSYMIVSVYDSIYDYHIWSNRIWLTVYDCPYMIVIYDRDRIWSIIYGQSYMVFRIWSYVVTIYGSVYDDHIWSPPTIIYGLHMRCGIACRFLIFTAISSSNPFLYSFYRMLTV